MFARPLINKIILSPRPLLYNDDLSHTGIIVKLTTKSFLVAPGPGQKSQAQPETSPVARDVAGTAHQLNPTYFFLHTTGRSQASEVERRGFLRIMRGFLCLALQRVRQCFLKRGHSTSATICVPLKVVVILDSHKMVYIFHIKIKLVYY